MNTTSTPSETEAAELRRRAEQLLAEQKPRMPDTTDVTERLLHELQVHKIELEMQNEELRLGRDQLETALERYTELYDFAPVGYMTLNQSGRILEINLTGAAMLSRVRSVIVGRPLIDYLNSANRERLRWHLRETFREEGKVTDEFKIEQANNSARDILLVSVASAERGICRSIMTDISQRKQMDKKMRELANELRVVETRERHHLAQELHDNLCQLVAVAKIKLSQFSMTEITDSQTQKIQEISHLLECTLKSMNAMVFQLSPPMLDNFGLYAALQALAAEFKEQYGFDVHIIDDGLEKPLPQGWNLILYRAVRELLINAIKHADVTMAEVEIRRIGNEIRISVRDKGKGFDNQVLANGLYANGFGLFSIKDQLDQLGGSLAIATGPGEGANVTLVLPIALPQCELREGA